MAPDGFRGTIAEQFKRSVEAEKEKRRDQRGSKVTADMLKLIGRRSSDQALLESISEALRDSGDPGDMMQQLRADCPDTVLADMLPVFLGRCGRLEDWFTRNKEGAPKFRGLELWKYFVEEAGRLKRLTVPFMFQGKRTLWVLSNKSSSFTAYGTRVVIASNKQSLEDPYLIPLSDYLDINL